MYALALLLDLLGVLLINARKLVTGVTVDAQQFVQLYVDGLRVAMLGALDQKRHEPRPQGGDPVPFKRLGAKYDPGQGIERKQDEGGRPGCKYAEVC